MLHPVQCPWCCEVVEFWVDPDIQGQYVEDCEVCCRPWQVHVQRDEQGEVQLQVDRA